MTLSQFRHVLGLETEIPLFPDGIGPLHFLLLYTRWQVTHECIYTRACGLVKGADAFGGSARDLEHLPRNLREARAAPLAVGGTLLRRRYAVGTLRPAQERLTPGRRPRGAINPAGAITNPNPIAFLLANLNTRSRLDGPADFGAARFKGRAGAYNPRFHSTYLAVARRGLGEAGFELLRGKFDAGQFLTTQRGEVAYLNSAISRLNRDPATAADAARRARLAALVAQRDEILLPGGDPADVLLDYHALDPSLQREFLFPEIAGSEALNLIATRPDENLFEVLAESSAPELLTTPFGASQGPRQTAIPYLASLDFPIRPFGYFREGGFDLTDLRSRARYDDTLPARPPNPEGGLVFRSPGLRALERRSHHLVSNLDQDFDEDELRWGHGASEDEHEFREGYLELEFMRGQILSRVGKLLMIWGKTELFRNVDVLNPIDLSDGVGLGRLDETRIGQWAVQLLFAPAWAMQVGEFSDLRLELAVIFDDFEPRDLGRCGETGSLAAGCLKGFGAYTHGLVGLELAGEVRPDDRYGGLARLDYGLRLEGRWRRFAFSISDFWGWRDDAVPEVIFEYARRVDPSTGAPVNAFGPLECRVRTVDGLFAGPDANPATLGDNQIPSVGNCLLFDDPPSPDAPQPLRATASVAANHAVNQTLFHLLCTLTYDPDLGYCPFDQATDPTSFIPVSQILSGQPGVVIGVVVEGVDTVRIESQPVTAPGFRQDLNTLVPVLFRALPEADSLELSPTQGALLGCGPAFASVCGEAGRRGFGNSEEFIALRGVQDNIEAQGGVDLMNADASVFSQEFTVLKALQPGALVGTRGRDGGLRYEAGIRVGGVEVAGSDLGIDAADLAPLSLRGRAERIRSALESSGRLEPGAPLSECAPPNSRGSVQTGCTDAWIEPMPWKVDPVVLARGRVAFQVAPQTERDPRCDPAVALRDRDGDGVAEPGPRDDGFTALEQRYCKNRVGRWTPEDAADILIPNDPTDPTNPANVFQVEFEGDEDDLFEEDGSRSAVLLEWVERIESVSEHCTSFISELHVSRTVAGSYLNRGCTNLEVISANFERLFIALDVVGDDRAFDPPETAAELLAMLDGDFSNDVFSDPLAGPDGIVAKNWRVFRDPSTGRPTTVNDVHVTQFESPQDVVSLEAIAPRFDRDGDGVADGASSLDLSEITFEEFHRGFVPDAVCPNKSRCHLQTATAESLVGRAGAPPRKITVATALPIVLTAELQSIDGEQDLSPILTRPKINLLALFETRPLEFAKLWSGQDTLLEEFTLRYDRSGFREDVKGDVVLRLGDNLRRSLSQSHDGDSRGTPDADVNVDNVYDGLDDGAPGPISDDNVLCGSGIPGDFLQSAPQADPFSEAEAMAIAALDIGVRSATECDELNQLLDATGQTLPLRRAGGDASYGRRDFLWHGGQQRVLSYDKRNVLGFGVDFAEDWTRTSWNIEVSWANDIRIPNSDRRGGLSNSDEYALTVSVDRPTFIKPLNRSRNFFVNFQVFLRYLSDFHGGDDDLDGNYGFASGPLSGQASLTFFTGYFHDALQPRVTLLWEPRSASAAVLWAIGYRFRTNLAANLAVNHFFGRPLKQRRSAFPSQLFGDSELHEPAALGQSAVFNEDTAVLSLRYSW